MLPTHNVVSHPSSLNFEKLGIGNQPETGEFDFFTYLLGLQGSSNPLEMMVDAGAKPELTANNIAVAKADDSVVSLFQKTKEETPTWNPMLPSGVNPLAPSKVQVKESPQVSPDDLKSTLQSLKPQAQRGAMQSLDLSAQTQVKAQIRSTAAQDSNAPDVSKELRSVDPGKFVADKRVETKTEQEDLNTGKIEAPKAKATDHARLVQKYSGNTNQPKEVDSKPAQTNDPRVRGHQGTSPGDPTVTASQVPGTTGKANHSNKTESTERKKDVRDTNVADGDAEVLGFEKMATAHTANVPKETVHSKAETHTVPEMLHRVQSMVQQGGGKMTVRLSPPDLGQVDIQVTTKGKRVEVEMASTNDLAKHVIESKLSDLKNSLHNQDLILSKMEVHVQRDGLRTGADNNFSNFNGNNPHQAYQQTAQQGFSDQSSRNSQTQRRSSEPTPERTLAGIARVNSSRLASGSGRVDVRI